jgi:NTE family protein
LLNRLTWPVHEISDFSRLPIPFRCVAADIATGEAVVLDRGHLATAIRASMAIPSAFTPVELGGRLLVDGGIVRNLPASDARDMGAGFIIGVDITPRQKDPGESQWSIVQIINQAANLVNTTTIAEQRAQCDILISPDMEGYNLFSFSAVDSLIALGERAARMALAQWDTLASSRPASARPPERSLPPGAARSVRAASIRVDGLHHVSRNLVEGRLMLDLRSALTADQIDAAVERVYGSGFFQRVSYRLEGGEPDARLVIEVKERSIDEMRVGLHYDTENETSLLFNITLRNRLGHGSRQLIEARLGRFLGFRAAHSIDMGRNPGFAVGTEYRVQDWRMDAHENGRLAAQYDMRFHEVNCRFEGLASNSFSAGLGGFWRWIEKKPSWLPVHQEWSNVSYHYGGFAAFFKMDNLDRLVYPYRGTRVRTEYRIVPDAFNDGAVFRQFDVFVQTVLPVSSRLAVLADAQAGRIYKDKGREEQTYMAGGLPGPGMNLIPFPGFEAMSRSGRAVAALKAGIRFEPRGLFFVTAELGSLNTGEAVSDLFRGVKGEYCWDFSAGVLTPFGPLQWILSGSQKRNRPISWVSLGYVF